MKKEKDQNCQNKENRPIILVCIDSTRASYIALKYACIKARILGFQVNILSVIESSHKNLIFGSQKIGAEKRHKIEKYIHKLTEEIAKEFEIIPVVSIREGDIANEIVNEVKSNQCYVMVIFGKSEKSQSDNTVLPKMAEKIGVKLNVPIVIVPENLSDNLFKMLS